MRFALRGRALSCLIYIACLLKMSMGPKEDEKQRRRLRDYLRYPRTATTPRHDPPKPDKRPKFAIPTGHHQGAADRYKQAVSLLKYTLEAKNEKWGYFDIPKLEEGALDPLAFKKGLRSICETYVAQHDRGSIEKCAYAVECCFTASAPFMKNALEIAKEGAAA
jgi:hypothetical protein